MIKITDVSLDTKLRLSFSWCVIWISIISAGSHAKGKLGPQTGTSTWRVTAACCRHFSPPSCFASEALKPAVRPAAASICVYVASNSTIYFYASPDIWVQNPERSSPSLFYLQRDGGATQPLPITDCHFDGDATGGESNSPSSSHWEMFTGRSQGRCSTKLYYYLSPCWFFSMKTEV